MPLSPPSSVCQKDQTEGAHGSLLSFFLKVQPQQKKSHILLQKIIFQTPAAAERSFNMLSVSFQNSEYK